MKQTATDIAVSLREINADTVRSINNLRVAPEQAKFVATNAESIAQAYFHPEAWFRGIYADVEPVGFVMLEDWTQVPDSDPDAPICLWRFMIDERHQGFGYGRKALELVMTHIRSRDKLGYMLTSCVEGGHSPKSFYIAFGFRETGEIIDGETVLRFNLDQDDGE